MKRKVLTVLLATCLISGSVLVPENAASVAEEETDGTGEEDGDVWGEGENGECRCTEK